MVQQYYNNLTRKGLDILSILRLNKLSDALNIPSPLLFRDMKLLKADQVVRKNREAASERARRESAISTFLVKLTGIQPESVYAANNIRRNLPFAQ